MKTALRLRSLFIAALAALPLAAWAAGAGKAQPDALGEADRQCLGCHGERGLEKTFASGAPLALHVDGAAFAGSVHASAGCAACHADVDPAKHPGGSKAFADAAAFVAAVEQGCRNCHEASFDAHSQGVHGKAQKAGAGPSCASCHGSHEIVRASLGTALVDSCHGCHAGAAASHAKWLPNSKLHLEAVACAACHAPAAGRRVELRFYDPATKKEIVSDRLAAAAANGSNGGGEAKPIDDRKLRDLVRAIDRGDGAARVLLAGRLEPATGPEGHRLLPRGEALKDCATCHRKGAEAFQNVSLSVVSADGQRTRYDAQKDVLHGVGSVESVRGFYAMGGTRIQALDVLLALALAGGISAPLGHFLVRKWMRRKESRND